MKATLLLSAIFVLSTTCVAQPVLTNVYDYQPGHIYSYKKLATGVTLDSSNIPTVGANLSWDFSSLTWENTLRTDTVISCSSSAYPSSFPTCSFVYKEYNNIQQFYGRIADTLFYLGNTYGTPAKYTPTPPTFIYPTVYHPDNFVYAGFQTTIPGVGVWEYRARYNAFGTLKLSNTAVYPNTGLYITYGGNAALGFSDYMWFAEDQVDPLLRIQFRHTPGNTSLEYIYASNAALTDVTDLQGTTDKIFISPNPAENIVNIQSAQPMQQYVIVSVTGKQVAKGNLSGNNTGISVADLPSGLYFIQCVDNKGRTAVTKLIKQ